MSNQTVGGTVRDDTGRPLPGVRVSNGDDTVLTDPAGRYDLPRTVDTAFVVLSRPAGWTTDGWWSVPARDDGTDFVLTPREQTLPCTLVQLTDVHVTTRDLVQAGAYASSLYAEGSFGDELAALLASLPSLVPGAQGVVITGDLTDFGLPEEFVALRRVLDASPLPVEVIPGNHDHMAGEHSSIVTRNDYLTNDGDPTFYESHLGPRWHSHDLPGLHVVSIDWHTHEIGLDHERQERWIAGDLATLEPGTPWLLLSHDQPASSILDALPWQPVGVLSGHWHTDRVVRRERTLHVNTAPAQFGGLDADAPMLRTVTWDGASLTAASVRPVARIGLEAVHASAWTVPSDTGRLAHTPAVAGDLVIVAGADSDAATGWVEARDARTGEPRWRVELPEPVKASPVTDGTAVAVRQVGGTVAVLEAATGTMRWQRQIGDRHRTFAWAAPLLVGDQLVVGEPNDLQSVDLRTGALRWRRTGIAAHHNLVNHASPVAAGDAVVLGTWPVPAWPFAVAADDGTDRWSGTTGTTDYFGAAGPVSVGTAAFDESTNMIVVPGHGRVTAIDAATGAPRWAIEHEGGSSPATPLVTDVGYVVALSGTGFRMLDRADGRALWSVARDTGCSGIRTPYAKEPRWTSGGAAAWRDLLVLTGTDGLVQLVGVDGVLGGELDLAVPLPGRPVVSGDHLYLIADGTALVAVDLTTIGAAA
jgi:outer membrane protein assembly factor BamB/predicted MPP superfamily phosphohydrolase